MNKRADESIKWTPKVRLNTVRARCEVVGSSTGLEEQLMEVRY